jgi:hypothetical protein
MPVSPGQALQAFRDAGYAVLAIKPEHAARVEALPSIHNDPFDRLLLAQARFEPMTLISSKCGSATLLDPHGGGLGAARPWGRSQAIA